MIHSAPVRPTRPCRGSGFTLIEILVVGFSHQSVETLLAAWVAKVIQPVEFQRIFDAAQVLLNPRSLRVINPADHIRGHDCCKNPEDDHHDHNFN